MSKIQTCFLVKPDPSDPYPAFLARLPEIVPPREYPKYLKMRRKRPRYDAMVGRPDPYTVSSVAYCNCVEAEELDEDPGMKTTFPTRLYQYSQPLFKQGWRLVTAKDRHQNHIRVPSRPPRNSKRRHPAKVELESVRIAGEHVELSLLQDEQ
jgi:hypothetical protein